MPPAGAAPAGAAPAGASPAARWPLGHPRRRQILLYLPSLLVVVIDNTILNTALPTLARVLHAGTSSLQWIADAYTVLRGVAGARLGRWVTATAGACPWSAGWPCSPSAARPRALPPAPAR